MVHADRELELKNREVAATAGFINTYSAVRSVPSLSRTPGLPYAVHKALLPIFPYYISPQISVACQNWGINSILI